jgi:iron-sulfur cluster insertion protein
MRNCHLPAIDKSLSKPNISNMDMPSITITPAAAKRIVEIAGPQAQALRVAVNGGGCSGFQYEFTLDAAMGSDDLVIESNGARVLIDSTSIVYLAGSELDFVDDLMGQAFKMKNPQAKSSCGCGVSFSL